MLRSSSLVWARACFRSSTSSTTGCFHTSTPSWSLSKTKPHEDEMPVLEATSIATRPQIVIDLSKKRLRRKEVNIIVNDTHLAQWTKMEPRGLLSAYLQLSKSKLTMLITATAVAGFWMAPVSISLYSLAVCTAGTALLSSAANACNQLLEAPYDAQMKRTQNRVLVVHRFSPLHAFSFAGLSATSGIGLLYFATNPLTASLGALNMLLYVGVYTPMKRAHIGCTWAGAVVGAIPPLMGYAAATGTLDMSAVCLAAIVYSWQFPHFNGLSWNLRSDYSRAGYRVMCVTNEYLCRVTSFRHSLALIGLCSIVAPLTNLTTTTFAVDSLPVNIILCWFSYKFYRAPDSKNSRSLFFASLVYLPLIMCLMAISCTERKVEPKKTVSDSVNMIMKLVDF